jgi:5-methylcytosine-specific restriction endonuclease McrA
VTKNINPLRTARRTEQRLKKLGWKPGDPDPSCSDCSESDIACLELDHLVGKDRDPKFERVVCRNCHRKREWKRDCAELSTNGKHKKETPQESHYRYLMLQASNLEEAAASLRRKAEEFRCLEGG